ncbi:MAG: PIG-L deacetylase family protein [Acidimicrobiia bacterium]
MSDLPGQPAPDPVDVSRDLVVPSSALAIAAHPDDVEFGCGATLAKWAAAGCVVHHLVCTDGSKGTWDPNADTAALVVTRQREQREAAKVLGATGEVVFLGWSDGELESTVRQRWEVVFWIRKLRPTVVLGHDPWRRYRLHPDHRNAGFLAVDGVVAARDPHFFPEQQIDHWRPQALLLWEADEINHYEDVTGFVDTKLAALEAHESQFESTMKASGEQVAAQLDAFRTRIRNRLAEQGRAIGADHAEAFHLITNL